MNWFITFFSSSIGKKIQMAITGLLICAYLVIHLFGNLFLYAGAEAFNTYVHALSSVKPIVRVIEVILVLIFLGHIVSGLRLTIENRRSNSKKYTVSGARETSNLSSRTMGLTGSIIFIFLVVHLSTIWWQFQIHHGGEEYYNIVMSTGFGFGNIVITIFYAIAMFLLGFHLRHGFQSAFQTFGIRYNKYGKLIEWLSAIFWLIIPLGFVSIPIYFGLLKGGF